MTKPLVAIAVDLSFFGYRHVGVLAGITAWLASHSGWDTVLDDTLLTRPQRLSRFAGVIARATPALASAARKAGVPIVNVWANSPVAARLPTVVPDWATTGRIAAEFLLARGFTSLGCVASSDGHVGDIRAAAFREAVEAAGGRVAILRTPYFEVTDPRFRRFLKNVGRWVVRQRRPFGLLDNSPDTRYLINEIHHRGLKVPDDVAILAAWHEPTICDLFKPTLSGVDVRFEKVGYEAAALMDSLMKKPDPRPRTVLVAPDGVVARDSTSLFAVEDDLLRNLLQHIEGHLDHPLDPDDLARRMAVTRRTLDRRFEKHCGRSVGDVIRDLRLARARQLLATTDLLVKQVAAAVGLRRGNHLDRLFIDKFGVSPSDYRRQARPAASQERKGPDGGAGGMTRRRR